MAAMACCIQASPVPRMTTCTFWAAAPTDTPSSHVLSSFAISLSASWNRWTVRPCCKTLNHCCS